MQELEKRISSAEVIRYEPSRANANSGEHRLPACSFRQLAEKLFAHCGWNQYPDQRARVSQTGITQKLSALQQQKRREGAHALQKLARKRRGVSVHFA